MCVLHVPEDISHTCKTIGQGTILSTNLPSHWNCGNHVGRCRKSISMVDFCSPPQQFHSHPHVYLLPTQNTLPKDGNQISSLPDDGTDWAIFIWYCG